MSSAPKVIDPAVARTSYTIRVRFRDTDLMGIVHHAAYLEYLEAGRVEYLRRRGVEYGVLSSSGVHLAVAEVNVQYRKPARFDERVVVETTLVELRRASALFSYRLLREAPPGELIAEASTLLACLDDDHKVRRIAPELDAVLRGAESHPRPFDQV